MGLRRGEHCIWVCVPYLNHAGTANVIKWWGDAPAYDPEPTLAYGRATVREVCEKFGGDAERVVLAGFSRGGDRGQLSRAARRRDRETMARVYLLQSVRWRADDLAISGRGPGVGTGAAAAAEGAGRSSFAARLRMPLRRSGICARRGHGTRGAFTVVGTGFRNHNDAWVLRPLRGADAAAGMAARGGALTPQNQDACVGWMGLHLSHPERSRRIPSNNQRHRW